jgi:hypothetical protein
VNTNKKAGLWVGLCTLLVIAGILVLAYNEAQPDKTIIPAPMLVPYITNNHGQRVESIPYQELGTWILRYNNAKIVSLVSVNDGTYGHTTAFIVVYEVEVPVEQTED